MIAIRLIERVQVVEGMQDEGKRAFRMCHLRRAVETVEPERDAMVRIPVVLANQRHEFPVRLQPSEAMAEAGLADLIERRGAPPGHVIIHDPAPEIVALDRDGGETVHPGQPEEETVPEDQERLSSVKRLPEAEEGRSFPRHGDHAIGGGIDGCLPVEREGGGPGRYPVVQVTESTTPHPLNSDRPAVPVPTRSGGLHPRAPREG